MAEKEKRQYLDKAGLAKFWSLTKGKFLPLSGGNVSGNLTVNGQTLITSANIGQQTVANADKVDGKHFSDIKVGGRNYFKRWHAGVMRDDSIHGYVIKSSNGINRIQNLGFEGVVSDWTVSFYIKASQACTVNVNLCDYQADTSYNENSNTNVTTEYVFHKYTFLNVQSHILPTDYNGFLDIENSQGLTIYVKDIKIERGTIATDWCWNPDDETVYAANRLATPRTIWGQSFDGTGNVRGLLTASTGTSHSGIKFGDAYISEMDRELIFQNVVALRFGADNWIWDSWAGLNYVPSTRTINLGIPDGKIFKWNGETKGGGTLNLPGITEFSTNGNLNIAPTNNLGIGTQSPDAKLHVAGSAHITGDATVDGTLNVKGNGLELYYTTPYIDFHYGNSTDDYDIRMINSRKGVLQINAATQIDLVSPVKASKGSLWVANGNTSVLYVNTSLMTSYVKAKFNLTSWFVGNVGIGTDAVSNAKLKVNGATYITGDCKIDGVIENGNFYTDADGWVYTPALRVGDESNEADIVLYDSDGNEHIFQLQKAIELGIFN